MNTLMILLVEPEPTFGTLAGFGFIILCLCIGVAIMIGIAENGWPKFKKK